MRKLSAPGPASVVPASRNLPPIQVHDSCDAMGLRSDALRSLPKAHDIQLTPTEGDTLATFRNRRDT